MGEAGSRAWLQELSAGISAVPFTPHVAVVRSGTGNFARFLEAYAEHYEARLGVRLFPGTLNLELREPWSVPAGAQRFDPAEYPGTVGVWLVPCRLFGRPALVLRTDANELGRGDHPATIVEIAAPTHLRRALGLSDGSHVPVELP